MTNSNNYKLPNCFFVQIISWKASLICFGHALLLKTPVILIQIVSIVFFRVNILSTDITKIQ